MCVPLAQVGASVGEAFFMGLPGFVADALPDGWGLLLMDRAFRSAGRLPEHLSVLDRLAFIGHRAMGALVFEPADDIAHLAESLELEQLAREAALVLADEHAAGSADKALRHLLLLGGSPQGARPKVLVNFDPVGGRIQCGPGDTKSQPWLIKFPAGNEHREVCAIKALYARLAAHCGLEMPESRIFELDGSKYSTFGVRRFDLQDQLRVPMQSLSAMLHVDFRLPSLDYEMLLRLTRRLTGDEREVLKAFERCVFNVLTHNRDDHGRNFTFCLDRQRHWKLSPPFDLTYSEGQRGEHFTTIAGEGKSLGRAHLFELAKRGGIGVQNAQESLDRLCAGMSALPELAKELPIRKKRWIELRKTLEEDRQRVALCS